MPWAAKGAGQRRVQRASERVSRHVRGARLITRVCCRRRARRCLPRRGRAPLHRRDGVWRRLCVHCQQLEAPHALIVHLRRAVQAGRECVPHSRARGVASEAGRGTGGCREAALHLTRGAALRAAAAAARRAAPTMSVAPSPPSSSLVTRAYTPTLGSPPTAPSSSAGGAASGDRTWPNRSAGLRRRGGATAASASVGAAAPAAASAAAAAAASSCCRCWSRKSVTYRGSNTRTTPAWGLRAARGRVRIASGVGELGVAWGQAGGMAAAARRRGLAGYGIAGGIICGLIPAEPSAQRGAIVAWPRGQTAKQERGVQGRGGRAWAGARRGAHLAGVQAGWQNEERQGHQGFLRIRVCERLACVRHPGRAPVGRDRRPSPRRARDRAAARARVHIGCPASPVRGPMHWKGRLHFRSGDRGF